MEIRGNFFDSSSSRRRKAVLRDQGRAGCLGVYDASGALIVDANAKNLNISSRVGNTPRFLRFPDGGVFETSENDAVDRLAQTLHPRAGLAHQLESRMRYVAVGLVATVIFIWAAIQYGIPYSAQVAAFAVSAENNRRIGQGVLEMLDKTMFSSSQLPAAEQDRLRGYFLASIGAVDGIALHVEFRRANKKIGANAFALPSGIIIFTDQLVQLAEGDEGLLGVFFHEAGHIERRHAMRGILQQSALATIIAVVTGDVSSAASFVAAAQAFLVQNGYSRDFEREADDFAVARLDESGISLSHYAGLLARLDESHRGQDGKKHGHSRLENYLSTHPAMAERLKKITGR